MQMMMLFNTFRKDEKPEPKAEADGFWIKSGQQNRAFTTLRQSFATQKEMEARGQKILAESRYAKVTYRLLPDGKSGALIFD